MNDKVLSLRDMELNFDLVPDNFEETNPYYRYKTLREDFLIGNIRNKSFIKRFKFIRNPSGVKLVHFNDKIHINIELVSDTFSSYSSKTRDNNVSNILLSTIVLGTLLTSVGAISTAVYAMRVAQAAEKELLLAEQQITLSVTPDGRIAVVGRWKGFNLFERFFKDSKDRRLDEITKDSFRRGSKEIWSLFGFSDGDINVDKPSRN
jgi:stress-induced morphogen